MLTETACEVICECGRSYWVTEELLEAIRAGKAENECAYCSGEHDGGE